MFQKASVKENRRARGMGNGSRRAGGVEVPEPRLEGPCLSLTSPLVTGGCTGNLMGPSSVGSEKPELVTCWGSLPCHLCCGWLCSQFASSSCGVASHCIKCKKIPQVMLRASDIWSGRENWQHRPAARPLSLALWGWLPMAGPWMWAVGWFSLTVLQWSPRLPFKKLSLNQI